MGDVTTIVGLIIGGFGFSCYAIGYWVGRAIGKKIGLLVARPPKTTGGTPVPLQ
jgi:hypothetical protein